MQILKHTFEATVQLIIQDIRVGSYVNLSIGLPNNFTKHITRGKDIFYIQRMESQHYLAKKMSF